MWNLTKNEFLFIPFKKVVGMIGFCIHKIGPNLIYAIKPTMITE